MDSETTFLCVYVVTDVNQSGFYFSSPIVFLTRPRMKRNTPVAILFFPNVYTFIVIGVCVGVCMRVCVCVCARARALGIRLIFKQIKWELRTGKGAHYSQSTRHAMGYTFRRRSALLFTCKGRTILFTFRKITKILCEFSKI